MADAPDERTIWQRLIDAQSVMVQPKLDSENRYFKTADGKPSRYASLKAVAEVVTPPLNANGLFLTQPIVEVANDEIYRSAVLTMVYNGKGDSEQLGIYKLTQGKPQETAGIVTYARRIMLCSAFGRVGQDDDAGNGTVEEERQGKLNQFRDVFGSYVKANKARGVNGPALKKELEDHLGISTESASPGQIQKAIEYIWDLMDKRALPGTKPLAEPQDEIPF